MHTPDPKLAAIGSDVAGVAWPPVLTGRAATLAALLHRLDRTQWLPPARLAERQRVQLGVLARWFAPRSPSFRERLDAGGVGADDLVRPGGLERLPVLDRATVHELGPGLFVDPLPPGHEPTFSKLTSGSTGRAIEVRRTAVNATFQGALTIRDYLWRDLDLRGRFAVLRASVKTIGERPTWGRPIDALFATGPLLAMPTDVPVPEVVDRLGAFRPDALLCYPSLLAGIAEHCRRSGRALPTLRHVQTMGENLDDEVRRLATDALAVHVWDLYSAEELGPIGIECPDAGGYHVPENLIVELLDDDGVPVPAAGIGRVVVTDLHNHAAPLIRYELGDHAEVGGPCPCGRGLPTLRRILGRTRNLIVLPDGSRSWPMTGYRAVFEHAGARQFQMAQVAPDLVEVRMVGTGPLAGDVEAEVAATVRAALHHRFELRFAYLDDDIPKGPSGKFEDFRCEIDVPT